MKRCFICDPIHFEFMLRWNRFPLLVPLPPNPTALLCLLGVSVLTAVTRVGNDLQVRRRLELDQTLWPRVVAPFDNLTCWNVLSRVLGRQWPSSIKRSLQNSSMRRSLATWWCGVMLLLLFAIVPYKCICSHWSDTDSGFNIRPHQPPSLRPTPAGLRPTFLILIYRLRPVCAWLMVY